MKEEKSNNPIAGNSKSKSMMDRRDFLKNLGGGLIIVFSVGNYSYLFGEAIPPQQVEEDLNAYLRIGEDGRVSLFTGKIEMGQGPITSLPQMLADELDVAYVNNLPIVQVPYMPHEVKGVEALSKIGEIIYQ